MNLDSSKRDTRKPSDYFTSLIHELESELQGEPTDPVNRLPDDRVRSAWQLFEGHLYEIIARYSRGDCLESLHPRLNELLRRREQLAEYGDKLPQRQQVMRRSLEQFDSRFETFDTYLYHLWWWSLAVCAGVSDDYCQRMLAVTGNAGQDGFFDQLAMALGETTRQPSSQMNYPGPHRPLLDAIKAPRSSRANFVSYALDHWYGQCESAAWYDNHLKEDDEFELADCYVGYWCFEAALVVVLFGVDDTSFRDHPYYPAELVRFYQANQ